ncbi:MAG: hypothetical protein ACLFTH_02790 [Candidatus Woesearchaeota archaeon]
MVLSEDENSIRGDEESDFHSGDSFFFDETADFDPVENDIYKAEFVDTMLDNDELSMDEAAFMMGYDEFN